MLTSPETALLVCCENLGVIRHDLLVGLSQLGTKRKQLLLRCLRLLNLGGEKKSGQELFLLEAKGSFLLKIENWTFLNQKEKRKKEKKKKHQLLGSSLEFTCLFIQNN